MKLKTLKQIVESELPEIVEESKTAFKSFSGFLNESEEDDTNFSLGNKHTSYKDIHQAMMEADKMIPEHSQIQESARIKLNTGKVQTDSMQPNYDKRAAYAMYGSPTENKVGTATNIESHEKKTGSPASATNKKVLKAFKHDPTKKGGVSKLFHHYGAADPTLISSEDRKSEVSDNFRKFAAMQADDAKNGTKNYAELVKAMRAKKLGKVVATKTKTDTVADLPGSDKGEENGHETLGFGGNPDMRRHYTDTKGSFVSGNACHGKGNCVNDCLAKNGCGGFDTTKGHRDYYDQRSSHNAAARHDHDLELYHQLHETAKKAKKAGKGVIVRPDVTTGHQQTEYADAISEHFGPSSEGVKNGTHAIVHSDTYGKMAGTEKDPHSKDKAINTAVSDQGIPVSKRDIAEHIKLNYLLRKKGADARIAYTAMKVRHHEDNKDGTEKTHSNPREEDNWKKATGAESTSRYDIHPSTPGTGEGENPDEMRKSYYDEKSRSGRYERVAKGEDGKELKDKNGNTITHSHYYTNHRNPSPMKDIHGNMIQTSYHDARGLELARHRKEHPDEHGINAISPATASTNFDDSKASIFHPPENIDSKKVHHVLHPDSPEAAKARKIAGIE